MNIEDIKLREIRLFLDLLKLHSIRELGRQTQMQPGQVSKWIQNLEKKVGFPLIERSINGVRPTPRALELIPQFEKLIDVAENLSDEGRTSHEANLTIASSSFFSTHFVPQVMKFLKTGDVKVRMIDLPPTHFISAALRGNFEYCIHSSPLDWPRTWTTTEIGTLLYQVYARKGHPIHKNPQLKEVLKCPFIVPIYWTTDGIQFGDDSCPIPFGKRLRGHETATAASAAEILKVTNQLGFLPDLVARKHDLEPVLIPSWKTVRKPVFLSVKSASVKQRQFEMVSHACREILKTFDLTH